MLRGSQGLTRGAQGRQTGATEAAWRYLWAPWGLPGEAVEPAWETLRDHLGVKVDAKLHHFAAKSFKTIFRICVANFHVFVFFPTLRIPCILLWILHVFRLGPFQENM